MWYPLCVKLLATEYLRLYIRLPVQQDGLSEQVTAVQKYKQFISWVHTVFTGTNYEESPNFA